MRVVGCTIAVLGVAAAAALGVLGVPAAYPVLLVCSLALWLVGIGAAAASLAPPRPVVGTAAAVAAVSAWPILLLQELTPLWGAIATMCGVVVASRARDAG